MAEDSEVVVDEDETGLPALERFSESSDVMKLIDCLPQVISGGFRAEEKACEEFQYIFNLYTEQPHLMDPYLDMFLAKIVEHLRNTEFGMEVKYLVFKYLYIITNVRGYKILVQHLPHEVEDLEAVLQMLEKQDPLDTGTWETRYGLLLWLSIIVMLPFDMTWFHSENSPKSVTDRLMNVCHVYLMTPDACHKIAAFLTARFLTRTDIKKLHFAPFLDWEIKMIDVEVPKTNSWDIFGLLAGLAAVVKLGDRKDLLPYACSLLNCILKAKSCVKYPLTSKYAIKIVARIGLLFLKPKANKWLYEVGYRSLTSPSVYKDDLLKENRCLEEEDEDEEEVNIPVEVEDVIYELVEALKNRFISTRLSASKGIARVMSRLSKQSGDQVVCYIINSLTPKSSDWAWHGGCLALAELARRGLLLPSRLRDVIPLVIKGLYYEVPRGFNTTGENVRDGAAYVCWAFARAYRPEIIKPYSLRLATNLITVACFDREIHCRRAAAAAFQEIVGRMENFPHGIDILTSADYFTVGSRSNAFLNVSMHVAQYGEYTHILINHLLDNKVSNWDPNTRILASKVLFKMTNLSPQYLHRKGVARLLDLTKSPEINTMHGAVLALGQVVLALSHVPQIRLDPLYIDELEILIRQYNEKNLLKRSRNQILLVACCCFIENCSEAKLPFHGKAVIGEWQHLIDECMSHMHSEVREAAGVALRNLCQEYYANETEEMKTLRSEIVVRYTGMLQTNLQYMIGCSFALGCMPHFMLRDSIPLVVMKLLTCVCIKQEDLDWAEAKSGAIKALCSICCNTGVHVDDNNQNCRGEVMNIMKNFIDAMNDYTITNQGDIGALVRESAMQSLQSLLIQTADQAIELLEPGLVTQVVATVAQQAVERIDRTRGIAGKVFFSLLYPEDREIPYFPARQEVQDIFSKSKCSTCHWTSARETFPLFIPLVTIPEYAKPVLIGLITSIGGMFEHLACYASEQFFNHLQKQSTETKKWITALIIEIYDEKIDDDRIAVPILPFLEHYLSSGCLEPLNLDPENTFALKILANGKKSIFKTSNSKKLSGFSDLLHELLKVGGEVSKRSLVQIGIFLCHRYKWLRKRTASKLYESILINYEECGVNPEVLDEVLEIVSDTEWDDLSLEVAREKRNDLFRLMNIPLPRSTAERSTSLRVQK